jgi:hypothetical protein
VSEPRWRVGKELERALYRNDQCVGMVDSPELAAEIVAALNGVAPNDRDGIVASLSREANRIFNKQNKDYPSNVLDAVAWNIRAGENDFLTERKHPSGRGMEVPNREDCPACAKVLRHPGEGYVCVWHDGVLINKGERK